MKTQKQNKNKIETKLTRKNIKQTSNHIFYLLYKTQCKPDRNQYQYQQKKKKSLKL